jgi:hypothetical protein
MYLKRYIPELQALCAKQIASVCRSMSQCERYVFMKRIPVDLKALIYSFPINYIEWCHNEQLLNIKIIQYYVKNKKDAKMLPESYTEDCEKGITREKVLWRKCQNVYCDDLTLQKIHQTQHDIYWGVCKNCEEYRIPHHKLMKLHLQIQNKLL